jgi:hypothetical protein
MLLMVHGTALAKVEVTNMKSDSDALRYPLPLVEGRYDGKRLIVESEPRGLETSITCQGNKFRFPVDLKPGENVPGISDGEGTKIVKLTYKPATNPLCRIKAWYVVCKGDKPLSPDFNAHLTPLHKERISTQVKIMQALSAEDMKRGGYGPRTLHPLFDAKGKADVGVTGLPMTSEGVLASPVGAYDLIAQRLPEEYDKRWFKNLAFTSVKAVAQSRFDVTRISGFRSRLTGGS